MFLLSIARSNRRMHLQGLGRPAVGMEWLVAVIVLVDVKRPACSQQPRIFEVADALIVGATDRRRPVVWNVGAVSVSDVFEVADVPVVGTTERRRHFQEIELTSDTFALITQHG